ncbi:MAG: ATP-binding cassette domain-containing protein [Treponema sp.]|jgi:putative ABC transport system ATP-binding protein|nr:ATP-binding cassette domain-containing protein [Treponema sp.]
MIALSNVVKQFNGKTVLQNISIEINEGAFVAIVGKSGSGKTTLLNIMGLLEKPDSGVVSIDGKSRLSANESLLFYRKKAGFLFQNFALIEDETVEKNLKIALAFNRTDNQGGMIERALSAVGLSGMGKRKVYQLSGGEQQRVALARILVKNVQYIFADEPTGNLDAQNRDVVFDVLKNLNRSGKTIVFVTHDIGLAKSANEMIELKGCGKS